MFESKNLRMGKGNERVSPPCRRQPQKSEVIVALQKGVTHKDSFILHQYYKRNILASNYVSRSRSRRYNGLPYFQVPPSTGMARYRGIHQGSQCYRYCIYANEYRINDFSRKRGQSPTPQKAKAYLIWKRLELQCTSIQCNS
jgi:hypothetical protein